MTFNAPTPGLMLVHGNQPELLRDLVLAWLRRYPLAPLENEVMLVQSNGIAQWLKLALAADPADGGCGIAAALEISLPARFLWRVYRALLGRLAVPEQSPFDEERLRWRLLRMLPSLTGQDGDAPLAPLRAFLRQDHDLRKRFQLAERLADLFDQYQVYRADWLARWAVGDDVLIDARGVATPLPDGQRWQAALWRALLADVRDAATGGEASGAGRAAVHAAFMRRAAAWPAGERPPDLPRRVIVFGISSLPRQSLEVLGELSRWTQVLLCVHDPCRHYWADIVADRDLLRGGRAARSRSPDAPPVPEELLHLHAPPLLAAWGKQGRDFIGLLDEFNESSHSDQPGAFSEVGDGAATAHRRPILAEQRLFVPFGGAGVLQQLQDDILELRPLHETRACWPPVDPACDASLRFHVAHSPRREVEILHDQLLAAFNADASLRPREVIVMVPEIDAYAPHIQAVFGLIDADDPRYLPFNVADQGRRRVDPLPRALEQLLALPQSRLAVGDLLDLLDVPALRRCFAIAEDDLPRLQRWIRGANIRWGLHAEQRAGLDLPHTGAPDAAQNTWLFGMRRMLLGYAVGADAAAWRGIEPYDEIGGIDAALLGPLARLLERLDATWRTLRAPAGVAVWGERLRRLLADFFVATDDDEAYTLLRLETALREWEAICDEAALREDLPLTVVGEHWLAQLEQRGLSQRFFGGAITFATLMPMRAIPFRLVCLLGMNDGDYPRRRVPMDFDLMAGDYRPGDRSRREDDRYLFLEALLSARERLHISWVGRDINDNSARPPSVLVAQLRDHLAAGWTPCAAGDENDAADTASDSGPGGAALLAALTVEHPLQPFNPLYFTPAGAAAGLFSYAREWLPPAIAESPPPAEPPLPPPATEEALSLQRLGEFLKQPVRVFFRQRLGVYFADDDPVADDQEPFELDQLGRWQLQDELIQAQATALARGDTDAETWTETLADARAARLAAIRRRGDLPAGEFGRALADDLLAPMAALFERYRQALARWPRRLAAAEEIRLTVDGDGQELTLADRLDDLRADDAGRRGRVVLESSELIENRHYRGEKIVGHWLRHLALHLAGEPLTTEIVGKIGTVTLPPLPPAEARRHLAELLRVWRHGMRRPLPLAARTAFVWLREGRDAAARCYDGAFRQIGEARTDAYLRRVYPDFAALTADGEFFQLAETLLRPLHAALPVGEKRGTTTAGGAA